MKSFAALPFPDVLVIVNINLHPLVCCQFWIKPKRCFRCLSSVRCHKGSSLNNNFIVRNAIYCCFQRYLLAVRTFYILDLGGSLANCDLIITPPVPLEVGAILDVAPGRGLAVFGRWNTFALSCAGQCVNIS